MRINLSGRHLQYIIGQPEKPKGDGDIRTEKAKADFKLTVV